MIDGKPNKNDNENSTGCMVVKHYKLIKKEKNRKIRYTNNIIPNTFVKTSVINNHHHRNRKLRDNQMSFG